MDPKDFDLIKEFGLESLPPEKQQALQDQIIELIETRFNRAILNRLSDADQVELDKLLGANDPESMNKFMADKVPDFVDIHGQIIEELKAEMMKMRDVLLKV